ncbi:aminodeoxychorismate lyase [Thermoclostridium stercorarium subsp. stercorarium DSM 8532]|uniref:Endolytic murein transglycosylase n=1 Tax=Thermoclostridium stercorarium (strain ATCC 35414 / DSM 8532 / NCIMB 11754) TaxID=1121335 RepID=L7VPX1_THES1|nr:endolytic transglycosylase MltG [Thermoclostridium stercorarium]AGC68486.1 aminodeoxychorismate lyase [Thermoclostridium stercorarium subsp. stercorarium DSM 8532]
MVKQVEKKKRRFLRFLIFVVICMTLFFSSAYISYSYLTKYGIEYATTGKIQIPKEEQIEIVIPEGYGTADIAELLHKEGLVEYPWLFRFLSKLNGYDGKYKAGKHIVSKKLNYEGLMIILTSDPEPEPTVNLRIPEGFTVAELIDYLSERGYVDRERFETLCKTKMGNYKFLENVPDRTYPLEGYLYPDTYKIEEDWKEEEIIDRLLREFDTIFKPEYYERAEELGMTVDQVVTLASIIEMEAKYHSDYKKISSVLHNRLNSEMYPYLQVDVTLQYARIMAGLGRIQILTNKDKEIDSPYNTYKYKGLPPGPICSPRVEAIEAALYPEDTDYFFFFATPDGTVIYNKTLEGHNRDLAAHGMLN